jgi:hypothetical protein
MGVQLYTDSHEFSLIGTDKSILLHAYLNRSRIIRFSNGEDLSTISIDFQNITLIVLDNTQVMKTEKLNQKEDNYLLQHDCIVEC